MQKGIEDGLVMVDRPSCSRFLPTLVCDKDKYITLTLSTALCRSRSQ